MSMEENLNFIDTKFSPIMIQSKYRIDFSHLFCTSINSLFERDESRRVGGANTRSTVLDRLVRDAELSQVMSDHFGLQKSERNQGKVIGQGLVYAIS